MRKRDQQSETLIISVVLGAVFALVVAVLVRGHLQASDGAAAPAAESETPVVDLPPPETPLPWHPDLVRGQLDNGLSYYVLPHQKPAQRANLWLVVRAGSVHEQDDQLGMAHFLEHMAFNGTEKYDKQAIVDYLESIGMRFAADVNAATSFDKTVYKLKVPTDEDGAVDKGLDVLHEWAAAIKLDPAEVVSERGVVLEEWRARRGSGMRIAEELLPITLAGSPYPDRLPIGTPESIEGATAEQLERFYRDWYRPELMAVIAVGDFQAGEIEGKIKTVFADLENPEGAPPRPEIEVPMPEEYRIATMRDPELSDLAATLIGLRKRNVELDYGAMRRTMMEIVGLLSLGKRLADLAEAPDAPFVDAGASPADGAVEGVGAFGYAAQPKDGRTLEALESLLREMRRAELHGFGEDEVEKVRLQVKMMVQMVAAGFEDTDGAEHAQSLVDTFALGDVFTGPGLMEEVVEDEIDQLTAEQVSQQYALMQKDLSKVVVLLGPDSAPLPSEAEVRELTERMASADVEPWGPSGDVRPLIETPPAPGSIAGERTLDSGIEEWTLSNGARVLVKQTDFKEEEVLFRGTSAGGFGKIPEADHQLGAQAPSIVMASGAGDLGPIELRDALTGRGVSVNVWMNGIAEFVDGAARSEDVETMLQLVHLRMTGVRDDSEAYQRWHQAQVQHLEKSEKVPMTRFNRQLNNLLWKGHPRQQNLTADMVKKFDHKRALEIYRDRFVDRASDFVFAFVGDFDPETLKPLVARYLASIPAGSGGEEAVDTGATLSGASTPLRMRADVEPRSTVSHFFYGSAPWTRKQEIELSLVKEILRLRLREVLREGEGGTYSVSVGGFHFENLGEHYVSIRYSCDPDRVEPLRQTLLAELQKLRAQGPTEAEMTKVRETWTREHEEAAEDNGYWRRVISRAWRKGVPLSTFHNLQADLSLVNKETFLAAMKRFVPADRRFEAIADPLQTEAEPAQPQPAQPSQPAPAKPATPAPAKPAKPRPAPAEPESAPAEPGPATPAPAKPEPAAPAPAP